MQDNKERKMSENTGSFIKKKRQYQEMGMKILHTCRSEICARFPSVSYTHLEDREIGGLGIFLVKKTMDELSYEYVDGQNILTMKKELA